MTNLKEKTAYIFAGVNGAGKTTLYYNELEKSKDFGLRINIDEIVSSFGDYKSSKDQMRASKIALKMRQNYINKGLDFNQESTLCGSSILSLFKTLKEKGYKINLYYIGVDSPQIAKERIKIRVAKGGHFIKDELVEKRFYKSLENLKKVLPLCDEVKIFDNSKECKQICEIKDNKIKHFTEASWLKKTRIKE